MEEILESIECALLNHCWYAALFSALLLPDICGQKNGVATSKTYADWFREYLQPKYTRPGGAHVPEFIFIKGEDCYALRCSICHNGIADIRKQRVRQALDEFVFIAPPKGFTLHCNHSNSIKTDGSSEVRLQLQVDIFVKDMLEAVRCFLRAMSEGDRRAFETRLIVIERNFCQF